MTQFHLVRGQIVPVIAASALLPNGREWGASVERSPSGEQRWGKRFNV